MKIAMANDHAGTALKNQIKAYLEEQGYEVKDFGTYDEGACDLSDFVYPAALAVAKGECDRGIFVDHLRRCQQRRQIQHQRHNLQNQRLQARQEINSARTTKKMPLQFRRGCNFFIGVEFFRVNIQKSFRCLKNFLSRIYVTIAKKIMPQTISKINNTSGKSVAGVAKTCSIKTRSTKRFKNKPATPIADINKTITRKKFLRRL